MLHFNDKSDKLCFSFSVDWQILEQESGAFPLRITRDSVSNCISSISKVSLCFCYICHLV